MTMARVRGPSVIQGQRNGKKPPEPVVTGELKVTHPIDALRKMLASEIDRTGPMESFFIRSGLLADLLDELARHRTAHALPGDVGGWVVGSDDSQKWRMWTELGPAWTDNRDKATRYARRVDAEEVHAADEDAWRVEPFAALPSHQGAGE